MNIEEQEQIEKVESFFKNAFIADKATLINVTEDMKNNIEIKSLVKLETSDRGIFYVSMIDYEEVGNSEGKS